MNSRLLVRHVVIVDEAPVSPRMADEYPSHANFQVQYPSRPYPAIPRQPRSPATYKTADCIPYDGHNLHLPVVHSTGQFPVTPSDQTFLGFPSGPTSQDFIPHATPQGSLFECSSAQTTPQEYPFIFNNVSPGEGPSPGNTASLLAILNGLAQDSSFYPATTTPSMTYERIFSMDDPPVERPTPIGAKTTARRAHDTLSHVHGGLAPSWPPAVTG